MELKIDAHQHFWQYDPDKHSWIDDGMQAIRRDFMPDDLQPLLELHGFEGCIAVQCDQSEAETSFQLLNAERYKFIKGVVGWVDMNRPDIGERLIELSSYEKLKGFRHVLQDKPQRDYMLNPSFLNGIRHLADLDFTYDILIYPDQLPYAAQFVAKFPQQCFVLDHIAKPPIKVGEIASWASGLNMLAQYENVNCKISGLVTEADWANWKVSDFNRYLDCVLEAFGPGRILFGSDWPVCNLAASYHQVNELVKQSFAQLSEYEQELLWSKNARKIYRLAS